ncbi:MAG TPA: hypothetical protein RMH99_22330 [Sandaracinaceae bacterium LLY-WYZ-13_1]|nr:hypothetical protein [Sandaracinaceae bacterium LLY-WYZ-13_1]
MTAACSRCQAPLGSTPSPAFAVCRACHAVQAWPRAHRPSFAASPIPAPRFPRPAFTRRTLAWGLVALGGALGAAGGLWILVAGGAGPVDPDSPALAPILVGVVLVIAALMLVAYEGAPNLRKWNALASSLGLRVVAQPSPYHPPTYAGTYAGRPVLLRYDYRGTTQHGRGVTELRILSTVPLSPPPDADAALAALRRLTSERAIHEDGLTLVIGHCVRAPWELEPLLQHGARALEALERGAA